METTQFKPVATGELDDWFARSNDEPVLLFKHSNTCPVSAAAYGEMERVMSAEVGLIVVQKDRELSREVEQRTGVRHESPQALVLRRGEVVWSASHFAVTAEAVEDALGKNR